MEHSECSSSSDTEPSLAAEPLSKGSACITTVLQSWEMESSPGPTHCLVQDWGLWQGSRLMASQPKEQKELPLCSPVI